MNKVEITSYPKHCVNYEFNNKSVEIKLVKVQSDYSFLRPTQLVAEHKERDTL